ncbi:hypothetical protein C723_2479 [Christiangramia flava JLT2011]|uniref:Uncharacterized protein n=1 Tax=Christiangramia flava JLT2011 TaxID=1229726 RepID=A0A1L7I613_9FLAO|nr:hypothetical protein GRFL_2306 [Christiangramia flava JLT2011]OSS38496.1 hypothetical protein C723_2479 [Christiangramia flava JLT2011]
MSDSTNSKNAETIFLLYEFCQSNRKKITEVEASLAPLLYS